MPMYLYDTLLEGFSAVVMVGHDDPPAVGTRVAYTLDGYVPHPDGTFVTISSEEYRRRLYPEEDGRPQTVEPSSTCAWCGRSKGSIHRSDCPLYQRRDAGQESVVRDPGRRDLDDKSTGQLTWKPIDVDDARQRLLAMKKFFEDQASREPADAWDRGYRAGMRAVLEWF